MFSTICVILRFPKTYADVLLVLRSDTERRRFSHNFPNTSNTEEEEEEEEEDYVCIEIPISFSRELWKWRAHNPGIVHPPIVWEGQSTSTLHINT